MSFLPTVVKILIFQTQTVIFFFFSPLISTFKCCSRKFPCSSAGYVGWTCDVQSNTVNVIQWISVSHCNLITRPLPLISHSGDIIIHPFTIISDTHAQKRWGRRVNLEEFGAHAQRNCCTEPARWTKITDLFPNFSENWGSFSGRSDCLKIYFCPYGGQRPKEFF